MRKIGVLAMVAAILLLIGCACTTPEHASPDTPEAECSVEMLDVGQGLCILAEMDGQYLLYDGGGRETSSLVVRHLRDLGVGRIDLMVASHYDEDHISGLIGVDEPFVRNVGIHVAVPVLMVGNDFCDYGNLRLKDFSSAQIRQLPA